MWPHKFIPIPSDSLNDERVYSLPNKFVYFSNSLMVEKEFFSFLAVLCIPSNRKKKGISEQLFSIFCDMITSGSVTSIIKILFAFLETQISISGCDHSETSDSGSYPVEAGNSLSYSEAMILRWSLIPCNHCYTLGCKVTCVLELIYGLAGKKKMNLRRLWQGFSYLLCVDACSNKAIWILF